MSAATFMKSKHSSFVELAVVFLILSYKEADFMTNKKTKKERNDQTSSAPIIKIKIKN